MSSAPVGIAVEQVFVHPELELAAGAGHRVELVGHQQLLEFRLLLDVEGLVELDLLGGLAARALDGIETLVGHKGAAR
jgi:hypothetical protein